MKNYERQLREALEKIEVGTSKNSVTIQDGAENLKGLLEVIHEISSSALREYWVEVEQDKTDY